MAVLAGVVYFLPAGEKTSPSGWKPPSSTLGVESAKTPSVFPSGFPTGATLESVATPAPAPELLEKKSPPALLEIQKCLGMAGKTGDCLDKLFGAFYASGGTTGEALAAARKYETEDTNFRFSCHPVMHAIGRETFRRHPTVQESFSLCDQTCHSGCYHGAMERFLRGNLAGDDEAGHITEEEVQKKAASACDSNQPSKFRFQCLHGLGHALVFFLDYNLEKSLASCDVMADGWSRSSCYGGAFMENVFSATPEKRDLSSTDYHYPCNKLDQKYRNDCYVMQTTRMTEMGLSTERLFEECKIAGLPAEPGAYRYSCMQSIGRDLSNDARIKNPKLTSARCEIVSGEDRKACVRGVIFALIDNTWDGKYAFPFCASFQNFEDVNFCFSASGSYMKGIFVKTNEDIKKDCKTYLQSPSVCELTATQ